MQMCNNLFLSFINNKQNTDHFDSSQLDKK